MRIAVCDDDRKDLDEIVHVLSGYGNMDISAFSQSDDLLGKIENETFDVIILDIEMPGTNGENEEQRQNHETHRGRPPNAKARPW